MTGDVEMLINDYEMDLFCPPCDPGSEAWVATVHVGADLSELMPYMNAVVKNGYYDPDLPTLVWKEGAHKFFLRKSEFGINNLHDRAHAERKVAKFVGQMNDVWERRDAIEPDFTSRKPPAVLEVFKLLPRTNCRECGVPSCMAFAAKLSQGEVGLDECPPLLDAQSRDNLEKLRDMGL
jgi:ArsR family metal-binding transcriptional regulator